MRALKVFLTAVLAALAIVGGLLLTALVATAGVLWLLARRALGGRKRVVLAEPRAVPAPGESDIIDVTATELPAEPHRR